LQLLADWVTPGTVLADIGTDHAYLPVWLVLHGQISRAIAGDLRPGPLSRARATAVAFGVEAAVELRLCDGLSGIAPHEAETIAIAGMGGENIAAILAAAPWAADGAHKLLLQPMSRAEALRTYLSENGFQIEQEALAEDRGTIYPVLRVCGGAAAPLSLGQLYGGAALLRDPLEGRYLTEKIIHLQTAVAGLNRSDLPADAQRADHLRSVITALLEMKEVWRRADSRTN
jgi:tRNA (adenine22-N1)-methyltransferase